MMIKLEPDESDLINRVLRFAADQCHGEIFGSSASAARDFALKHTRDRCRALLRHFPTLAPQEEPKK